MPGLHPKDCRCTAKLELFSSSSESRNCWLVFPSIYDYDAKSHCQKNLCSLHIIVCMMTKLFFSVKKISLNKAITNTLYIFSRNELLAPPTFVFNTDSLR